MDGMRTSPMPPAERSALGLLPGTGGLLALLLLFGPLANAPAVRHGLLVCILFCAIWLIAQKRSVGRHVLAFCTPWLVLVLLSAFWSPDPRKTLVDALWEVYGPLAGCLLATHLAAHRDWKIAGRLPVFAVAAGATLAALGALHVHAGLAPSMPGWIVGTYQGLGVGSTVGVLASLVGLWAMLSLSGAGGRMAGGLLLSSGLLLGLLGHNRMFWFALMVGLLPWLSVLFRASAKVRVAILGLVLGGCLAGVIYSSVVAKSDSQPELGELVPALQSSYVSDPRWEIWQAWLEIIDDKPLLGYGYGSRVMPMIGRQRIPDTLRESTNAKQHAHNVFLNVVLQTGLVGLACFTWMLLGLWRLIGRIGRSAAGDAGDYRRLGALSLLLAALAKGLTDDFFWSPASIILWVFIGLMLGLGSSEQRSDPAQ